MSPSIKIDSSGRPQSDGLSAARTYQLLVRDRTSSTHAELALSGSINWADAPLKHTTRPQCASLPLPSEFDTELWQSRPTSLEFRRLAQLLLITHGVLRRKLDVNWDRTADIDLKHKPVYSRGSASGGGLYPVELYLIACSVDHLPAGVYHYEEAHNALTRIRMGCFEQHINSALMLPERRVEAFIVLTTRFWKNAFKYNGLSLQLATLDSGSSLGMLQVACEQLSLHSYVHYWYSDPILGTLLGLDSALEASMSLISLSTQVPETSSSMLEAKPVGPRSTELPKLSCIVPLERSRRVAVPQICLDAQLCTEKATTELSPRTYRSSAESRKPEQNDISLDGFPDLVLDLPSAALSRESCWGGLRASPAMTAGELAQCLSFTLDRGEYRSDLYIKPDSLSGCVKLQLMIRHVEQIPRAVYGYCERTRTLYEVNDFAPTPVELQSLYLMENYNLEQAAVVVAIIANSSTATAAWGDRSLRIVNAEAGLMAQRLYLACSSLKLGCGVVLGFDMRKACTIFKVHPQNDAILLLAFIGHRSKPALAYDFRVCGALK